MDHIQLPQILVLTGMPNSGKSHLMKYLVYKWSSEGLIDYVHAICPTKFNGGFNYIPDAYIHPSYSEELIKKILKQQEIEKKRLVLILDDCLGSVPFDSKTFQQLVSTHRHYQITLLISTQSPNKLPNLIRDCCGYSVMLQCRTNRAITGLYDSYGVLFETFKDFKRYFVKYTCNNYFILYTKNPPKGVHMYQILRAPVTPDFKLMY